MLSFIKYVKLFLLVLITTNCCWGQGGSLQIAQSAAIERLVERHIAYNSSHAITGYRIRIFRDNNATARYKAQETRDRFASLYPDTKTYINYDNPYFKVTAGDFRSRDDALALFVKVRQHFPKAFIVREHIRLPPLHRHEDEE